MIYKFDRKEEYDAQNKGDDSEYLKGDYNEVYIYSCDVFYCFRR